MALFVSLLVLGLAPWLAPARAPADDDVGARAELGPATAWVELTDGERIAGELVALADGVARVALASAAVPGAIRDVPLERLLLYRASAPDAPEQATGADVVWLAGPPGGSGPGSDRLSGSLAGGDDYGVRLALGPQSSLMLSFEHIERILPGVDRPLDLLASLPGGGLDDRVWRRRDDGGLDGVSGVLARFETGSLVLESALGDLPFALGEVLAVVLAETQADGHPLQGWPCRVALAGGSVFSAGLVGLAEAQVTFDTAFAGLLSLPMGELHTLLLGPSADRRPTLLSSLGPVEQTEWSELAAGEDVLFPWRAELGVAGVPLAVGGLSAATGLGVHAHSRLVFEVPPGARVFRAMVGLTDDVRDLPAYGSVSFHIAVDGRPRADSDVLREGDEPAVLRVDGLAPGQRLELLVDAGGDDEAGDRATWADAVFLP